MSKCINCGKSTGLFSKEKLCNKCQNFCIVEYETAYQHFNKFNGQISKGFNSIISYMSRFEKILQCVDTMVKCQNLIPNKITIATSKKEIIEQMVSIIDNFHLRIIEKAYSSPSNKTTISKIISYQEELKDCLTDYSFLKENIEKNYDNAQQVLEMLVGNPEVKYEIKYYFDINKMKKFKEVNEAYLINDIYIDKIIKDIETMNNFINLSNKQYGMNVSCIDLDKLNFEANRYDYVYLHFDPLTETGKDKKTPFEILFDITNEGYCNESHGRIYYNKDGEIQKSFFVSRENGERVIFETSLIGGENLIKKIYKTGNNGENIYIYK